MTLKKKSRALQILEEARARYESTPPPKGDAMTVDLLCYCLERFDEIETKIDELKQTVDNIKK